MTNELYTMGGVRNRIRTVTMNTTPKRRATTRKRALSIRKVSLPGCESSASVVISRINAVIAIQRFMSERERGKTMV